MCIILRRIKMADKKEIIENGKIESGVDLRNIYFLKIGKIRYLKSKNYKKNCCQICGKRRKTTAHHLVPRRLKCICPLLAEVRVRVCSECDKQFHPENKFIRESDIVKRQSKNISNLQDAIRWRDGKIRALVNGLKNLGIDITMLLGLKDEDFYITKSVTKAIINDKKIREKEAVTPRTFFVKKEVSKDGKK